MNRIEPQLIAQIANADPASLQRLLWTACRKGYTDAARALLQAGANPNALGFATLPLEEAADADRIDVVLMLLDADADPTLGRVMSRASVGALPLLLHAGGPIDGTPAGGNPLLWNISARRKQDRALALLQLGANVSVRDQQGATPLMLAAKYGRYQTFQQLLKRHADLLAVDLAGRSVARYAVEALAAGSVTPMSERPSVLRILRQLRGLLPAQPEDLLLVEVALGNAAQLEQQLAAGLNPDTRIRGSINLLGMNLTEILGDARNWLEALQHQSARDLVDQQVESCTLLMWAVALGQQQCVRLLLDAGADVNARMANDVSAADLSVHSPARVRKMMGTLRVDPSTHVPGDLVTQPPEPEPALRNRLGRLGVLPEKIAEHHASFLKYHADSGNSRLSVYHLGGYWERASLFYLEEKQPEMRRTLQVVVELGRDCLLSNHPELQHGWVRAFTQSAAACVVLGNWPTLESMCAFPRIDSARPRACSWYDVDSFDRPFWFLFAKWIRHEPQPPELRNAITTGRPKGTRLLLAAMDAIASGVPQTTTAALRKYLTFHRKHATSPQHGIAPHRAVSAEATILAGLARQQGLQVPLQESDTDLLLW